MDNAPNTSRSCSVSHCQVQHYAKGFCRTHYHAHRRGLQPSKVRLEYSSEVGVCAADGCDTEFPRRAIGSERVYCSRRCSDRTAKAKARLRPGYLPPHQRPGRNPCAVDGCDKPYHYAGYCPMHAERFKKYGDPGEVEARKAATGAAEWRLTQEGYLRRSFHGEIQLQHRWVMEQHLGRRLWPDESVHHRNGQRSDNRLENLELWSDWQPAGQRVEDKVAWAREILARYS